MCSVVSDSLWPHGLYSPWNSPGQNTGVATGAAVPFSRGSSQPRDWTQVSRIAGRFLTIWATREACSWVVPFLINWYMCVYACPVPQWCPLFCDPMDYNPSGSSVPRVSQARILEWVAISFSRGSSQPKDLTHVSCIGRQIFYHVSHQGSPIKW